MLIFNHYSPPTLLKCKWLDYSFEALLLLRIKQCWFLRIVWEPRPNGLLKSKGVWSMNVPCSFNGNVPITILTVIHHLSFICSATSKGNIQHSYRVGLIHRWIVKFKNFVSVLSHLTSVSPSSLWISPTVQGRDINIFISAPLHSFIK